MLATSFRPCQSASLGCTVFPLTSVRELKRLHASGPYSLAFVTSLTKLDVSIHSRAIAYEGLPELGLLGLTRQRLEFGVQRPDSGEWEGLLVSVVDKVKHCLLFDSASLPDLCSVPLVVLSELRGDHVASLRGESSGRRRALLTMMQGEVTH